MGNTSYSLFKMKSDVKNYVKSLFNKGKVPGQLVERKTGSSPEGIPLVGILLIMLNSSKEVNEHNLGVLHVHFGLA